jgi:hypothetical protein
MTWPEMPVDSMTAARPATVEVFSTVLREGRPNVMVKATFFSSSLNLGQAADGQPAIVR